MTRGGNPSPPQQRDIACIDAKQACETKDATICARDQGDCIIDLDGYDKDYIMTSIDNYYAVDGYLLPQPGTRDSPKVLNSEMTQSNIDLMVAKEASTSP